MPDAALPPDHAGPPNDDGAVHDVLTRVLRLVRTRLHDLHAALGLVVLVGAAMAALLTAIFAWVAHRVRMGSTQAFDERSSAISARTARRGSSPRCSRSPSSAPRPSC